MLPRILNFFSGSAKGFALVVDIDPLLAWLHRGKAARERARVLVDGRKRDGASGIGVSIAFDGTARGRHRDERGKSLGKRSDEVAILSRVFHDEHAVMELARRHDLLVIEDCCDALGSTYDGKAVGSFGAMSTMSFYAAHHMTMGEGGFVACETEELANIVRSIRDWGRDCYCAGKASLCKNGTCGRRFGKWLEGCDEVMDHKYIYSEIGYNLKPLEMQCAMGLAQIERIPDFVRRRKANFGRLDALFRGYEGLFHLPQALPLADPSWFAYPLTVRKDAGFKRQDIVHFLEDRKIQTRNLFAGNLLRHPAYRDIEHRVVDKAEVADLVLTNTFFLGVYPGLTEEMLVYMVDSCREFLEGCRVKRVPAVATPQTFTFSPEKRSPICASC